MIIADTSGLLAFFDSADPHHEAVTALVDSLDELLVVSPFVLAELDYLLMTRIGIDAEVSVLAEFARGAFDVPGVSQADLGAALAVIDRYRDQSIGIADAHQVVLAREFGTRDLLTLDRRHFDVVRPLQGGRFRIHPRRT